MTKRDIARVLNEIAFFVRFKGDNPYKARAYERAAGALLACPQDTLELINAGALADVPDIGPATAGVITELVRTGESSLHQEVRGTYPSSLVELGDIPGLSMKQIGRLYEHANIRSVAELQAACRNDLLLSVPGIGPKVQARLLAALGEYQRGQGYHLYANVVDEALGLAGALEAMPAVQEASLAGAVRRKLEVINEFAFVLRCHRKDPVNYLATAMQAVPNLTAVTADADSVTAASARGMPVRVTVAKPEVYGTVLLQATGSDEHLEQLLDRFREKGLSDWNAVRKHFAGAGEAALYEVVGLPFIIPELREGRGEIELALEGRLPTPLETRQIQGFFHLHTTYSDGAGTVGEMVRAVRDQGYRYFGISDHSQSAFYANGLKEPRIRAQWAEIAAVQQEYDDIHIFRGIEADILPDGSMDYPDELLAEFDFVIASVHSRFNLPEAEQTQRICRALSNPHVTMLGHPTGRLLLSRPGYRVDLSQIIEAAAAHHKIIEINGSRHRLDLDWRWARVAKARGVKFAVNPDAHATSELVNVSLGVQVARKAGLGTDDVVNTSSLSEIKAMLQHRTV